MREESMAAPANLQSLEDLVAGIEDGMSIAIPKDDSGVPMEMTRALIRRGVKDLHIIGVPVAGIAADLLIGAGCVGTVETSAITLGEYGTAPRFVDGIRNGAFKVMDATCPAIYAALQAGEKGIPFMPLRGVIGSDLLPSRPDWKVMNNPFSEEGVADPILLLPAINPDVLVLHAPFADRNGNVCIGRKGEMRTVAAAARTTLVTVEEIRDVDLFENEMSAATALPAMYVTGLAEARHGAWPLSLWETYEEDEAHLTQYAQMARSDEGFQKYMNLHVYKPQAAE
jgi:glutaconate CoA-transferase subunit A